MEMAPQLGCEAGIAVKSVDAIARDRGEVCNGARSERMQQAVRGRMMSTTEHFRTLNFFFRSFFVWAMPGNIIGAAAVSTWYSSTLFPSPLLAASPDERPPRSSSAGLGNGQGAALFEETTEVEWAPIAH